MRRVLKLVLATFAIVAPSDAFAGHEWPDGTMGPPQGRGYDTTMPQFPPRAQHSTSTPVDQPLCGNRPDTKLDTAAADPNHAEIALAQSRVTYNAKINDTCSA